MTQKYLKNRRGISPAITTVILLGVAVAAGIGVYSVWAAQANTTTLKGAIQVEAASFIKQSNGEEWLSMTIKNSGNKAITNSTVNLQVDIDSGTAGIQPFSVSPSPAALNPGQTASVYARIETSGGTAIVSQNVGESIPIDISAVTSDGSTIRQSTSVTMAMS